MTFHVHFCDEDDTLHFQMLYSRFLWSKSGYERCDASHDELDDSNQKMQSTNTAAPPLAMQI